ncbi:cobaltochelatase CobN subunit [Albimonas donghaensis]|uniref:Cobaltochelatase subunit CobN n=1 Tax=Albimonas donghaensis TaxID=356660 RepID=A0A1H3CG52_9RHOB|nr:cobaltochelatase subunit CobN [Albimonas donghaensis]SDX53121.1 cobaltochelatase CobN subunit [Albimonas donghaensis]
MHLLAAQPGEISDGTEPVDPAQDPADVVFVSAADAELAALSAARARLEEAGEAPSLRLASLGWLAHPYSVDLYLDRTATRSRLVIARVLGGAAYWRYGLEQFAARLHEAGIPFAALPGDDKPDETLQRLSTVSAGDWSALWAYAVEGGPDNAGNLLRHARFMLGEGPAPEPARPLLRAGHLGDPEAGWIEGAPVVAVVVYRALVQGAGLAPVEALCEALRARGANPLPLFVASLKDPVSAATLEAIFARTPPDAVVNLTSFAVGSPDGGGAGTVLDRTGAPVLQAVLASGTESGWADGLRGLSARDIAMNVALPEVDGRILSRAIGFKDAAFRDEAAQCPIATWRARPDRVDFVAELAANWARLARTPATARRVGIVLANYPNKDGRLANGVGLDTPAATVGTLRALAGAGYRVTGAPDTGEALMDAVLAGPTNWLTDRAARQGGARLSLAAYRAAYARLPEAARAAVEARWGPPEADPFLGPDGFALSILDYGHVVVGIQPARGYNIDPEDTYHAPDLAPPHNYLAFYLWLRDEFGAHALIHMGKHGNLEWLPGKALALSEACFPEVALGPLPHLYPFIVNDPGEGTQAKRRAQAVIVDHLTPPLTRAETYGDLRALEALVDEYYEAAGVDPRRIGHLRGEILSLMSATGLDVDAGVATGEDDDARLQKLDAYLCELKESQIRDGLHIFGLSPEGRLARDLAVALARVPRGQGAGGDASLIRALAADFSLDFDPLDCPMAAAWAGPRPDALAGLTGDAWRTMGDAVERLELFACALVDGEAEAPGPATAAVMAEINARIRPALRNSGPAEMAGLLRGLDGKFVAPGPSGAPTRGRLDVLPTGRNFFSVDSRAVPTRTAWALGWRSAEALIERHAQEEGDWPRAMALTAWGTANMRTGGDDIAQALALMGARPVWDDASRRVTGFEIIPITALGRPRVDVTLRVSGFFRDAFPAQMDLVASAAAAIMRLEEDAADNPAAARFRTDSATLGETRAARRVFGAKPGAYGAGLQAMIDERLWERRGDLAAAFLDWGGYAYGAGEEGEAARDDFAARLSQADAVVQNQDNREHDILDSDDYYQFEGGMAATVETLRGAAPRIWHNDHSRPERPVIRTLDEEIGRVVRARAVNPKWIDGVKRHGYKGAFEIAATVDYLFAFAATTHAVRDHHFDLVHAAYLEDEDTRAFIEDANPAALREIAQRLEEAIERGLWRPRSNSARALLERLAATEGSPS